MKRDPRYKIVFLDVFDVMTVLGNWQHHEHVSLPLIKGLPEDYLIVSVTHSFDRNAIGVMIFHDSFPVVPPGEHVPVLHGIGQLDSQSVALTKTKTKRGWEFLGAP